MGYRYHVNVGSFGRLSDKFPFWNVKGDSNMAAPQALIWPGSCSIFWGLSCIKGAYRSPLVRQIGAVIKCGVFFSVLVMAVHHIFTGLVSMHSPFQCLASVVFIQYVEDV